MAERNTAVRRGATVDANVVIGLLTDRLDAPLKELRQSVDRLAEEISRTYVRQDVYESNRESHEVARLALEARVAKMERALGWVASTVGVAIIGAVMGLILKGSGG